MMYLPVISQLKALLQSGRADTTSGEFYYTYRVIDPHAGTARRQDRESPNASWKRSTRPATTPKSRSFP